jgi:GNAT superfamily N-acetyltransferase
MQRLLLALGPLIARARIRDGNALSLRLLGMKCRISVGLAVVDNRFISLPDHPEGGLAEMLAECYRPLLGVLPETVRTTLRKSWIEFDRDVHHEPTTVGACGFVTMVEEQPVGFASWDPRNWPKFGRMGHNCVLPRYQGLGLGRLQILRVLEQLRARTFATVEARTDEHHFFKPARSMYESCGFRNVRREPGILSRDCATIVYEVAVATRGH